MIKKRRMRWAGHIARMRRGEISTKFRLKNLKETGHLEDVGSEGKIILKFIVDIGFEGVDSIHLAQDMDRWRALVNTVMNHRVPLDRLKIKIYFHVLGPF
jgi:hypothetical protein